MEEWLVKNTVKVVAVGVVAVALIGWLWWNHDQSLKNAAAPAQAAAKISGAQATAGGQAVNIVNGNAKKGAETDAKVQRITNNFNTYPAAKTEVPLDMLDAFNRGVCVFESARGLPECQRLQQPGP